MLSLTPNSALSQSAADDKSFLCFHSNQFSSFLIAMDDWYKEELWLITHWGCSQNAFVSFLTEAGPQGGGTHVGVSSSLQSNPCDIWGLGTWVKVWLVNTVLLASAGIGCSFIAMLLLPTYTLTKPGARTHDLDTQLLGLSWGVKQPKFKLLNIIFIKWHEAEIKYK